MGEHVIHDLVVYALIVLTVSLVWFLTREAVWAVLRLEHRDAQEALSRERG